MVRKVQPRSLNEDHLQKNQCPTEQRAPIDIESGVRFKFDGSNAALNNQFALLPPPLSLGFLFGLLTSFELDNRGVLRII